MKNRTCRVAWTMILLSLTAIQSLAQSIYEPYTFTTLAGNAGYGSADGTGSAAQFNIPVDVAVDSAGNVYVADRNNHTIRKVTPAGVVTTLAGLAGILGSADGTGSAARFAFPGGVAVDSAGNVYVADTWNNTIRKVTPAGVVTTLAGLGQFDANGNPCCVGSADGTGRAARFAGPTAVAVDSAGNVYVADTPNHTIRKVTPEGVVTTLAGNASIKNRFGNPAGGYADGTGSTARFNEPRGVSVDSAGNVYVADSSNHAIRRVTPEGVVTTLAGNPSITFPSGNPAGGHADGTGSAARFNYPSGAAVDSAGNVYVADGWNHTIRKVTPAGDVTTLAGNAPITDSTSYREGGYADGTGSAARFNGPSGLAVDSAGDVYVADTFNHTIRKVTSAGMVTTLAGLVGGSGDADGTGFAARFNQPQGVAVDLAGNVYVADTSNHTIRKVTPAGGVTTLAGNASITGPPFGSPLGGYADGTGGAARFNGPLGVAVDSAGNVYVADQGNNTIRKVTSAGAVTTLAGLAGSFGSADGTGSDARFAGPSGVAVDSAGYVYVADRGNLTIRKVTPAGVVTTLAGLAGSGGSADGTGSEARFGSCNNSWGGCSGPGAVAVGSVGNVYVADTGNNTIRKVTPAGVVTTLAGNGAFGSADGRGSDAQFGRPTGVAVDSAGNVYVSDYTRIRMVKRVGADWVVTTLAGLAGNESNGDGTGSDARFFDPFGVAVDSAGNVYVADTANNTIRKGYPAPMILNSGAGFGFNGGQFEFNLTGPAGQLVVVEVSPDLVNWLPIWTNTFAFPATLKFSDPQSGLDSNRFYRAVQP